MILSHIQPTRPDGIDPADFLPQSAESVPRLMERLRKILLGMSEPNLRTLIECFLIDDEFIRKFTAAPAGIRHHHAYQGGLLEHVVNMLNVADRIAEFYPEVDRDLLLTGIFLHDIGKIDELSFDRAFTYSDEGQLVGHLVLGVEILARKVAKVSDLTGEPFPAELHLRLRHMILSHHGTPEFGAVKVPMTPEAVALHYLDSLDAKVHTVTREIREDPTPDATWTPFNQGLGRRLFKGAPATGAEEADDL
jgi:3'-5' exoribonuclease